MRMGNLQVTGEEWNTHTHLREMLPLVEHGGGGGGVEGGVI